MLKLMVMSLLAIPSRLRAAVAPAEFNPDTLPEYALGISRRICSRKGFKGPLAVHVPSWLLESSTLFCKLRFGKLILLLLLRKAF